MLHSIVAFVAVCDAARVELHDQLNATEDKGGLIKVLDGSKCLAVYGKNIHASKEVTIFAEKCDKNAKHQIWKHEGGALKNVAAPGKCLDIFENTCKNGQDLILWPCNGQQNQQFQFNSHGIYSPKCARCLDVDMESDYKNVLMWTCGSTKLNQKMDWAAEFSLVEDAAEEVELEEKNPNAPIIWEGTIKGYKDTCVDVYSPQGHSEGLKKKGTNIVTWPCHGGQNQQWYYRDGQIVNRNSKMCLDIFENKCWNDQNIIQWPCNGQSNQQWTMTANGQIKSKKCGKCIDIDLKSNTKHPNLYNLLLWSCKSTSDKVNQLWRVGGR